MAANDDLTPQMRRTCAALIDRARRIQPRLERMRYAGRANEEDELRLQHIIASCEAMLEELPDRR